MQKKCVFRIPRSYCPSARPGGWRGININQIRRVMRLTGMLLFVAFITAYGNGVAQRVTISGKAFTLKQVFTVIEKQTGYVVLTNKELSSQEKTFSLSVTDMPLKTFLDKLSGDQSLKYIIQDKTIVLSRNASPSPNTATIIMLAPEKPSLSGQLLDEKSREPVIGVTIRMKHSGQGTTSDASGRFFLRDLTEDAVLIVSSVGYAPSEIPYKKVAALPAGDTYTANGIRIFKLNTGGIVIYLSRSTSNLDESVVVAYGTTTQRFNTGSVVSVKAEEIEKQPVSNVLAALEGHVAGLFISQSNGAPGSQMKISIREQQSITSGKLPLFIIDGVPFVETPINLVGGSTSQASGATGYVDPMNSINPADIESISVLKDGDATAIYGSRGANGVVLITTKKGKAGDTRFDVNAYTGAGRVTNMVPMMNLQQYLAMRHAAFANDNVQPDRSNAPDLTLWDTTRGTDFLKKYIGNTAHQTEITGALSGGSPYLRYRFSNTWRHESTVFPGDWGYNRYASHLSVDNTSRNGKFSVTATALYTKESNNQAATDLTSTVAKLSPNYALHNNDGTLNWTGGFTNPESYLIQSSKFKSDNLLANAVLRYTIIPGLNAKISVGYNKISQSTENYQPKASLNPNSGSGQSMASYSSNYIESYIVEPQLDYTRALGRGRLNILAGGTWQQSDYAQPYYVTATGFSNDRLMSSWVAASTILFKSSSFTEYKYVSAFGRLNYVLDDRYLFNFTGRRDGSSRFGPGRQFGNFGSVGAGWIFSSEPYVKTALPWLSYGKIRGSYGTIGNDQINDYGYLSTYGNTFYGYNGSGIYPVRSANPDYGWESNRKVDIALETGLLKDHILFTASWFSSRTGNQLVNIPLASQSGFSSYTGNMPALLQSSGWEFELKTTNVSLQKFSWNSSFNITFPRNKLLAFPGLSTTAYAYVFMVGEPIGTDNGYHYTGLQDGIATVEDLNKDGKFTQGLHQTINGDYNIIARASPDFYGGFSNTFRYGKFQLDVFMQFAKQKKQDFRGASGGFPGGLANQDADIIKDGFKPTVTVGGPAAYAYQNYYLYSDGVYSNAAFIRLKNVNLSYELPTAWAAAARLKSAGAFIRAQNLFTITSYFGFDPETGGTVLPPLKQIAAGIHCSL
ncbi:SusC/RagA family TonB-linked outer membrane protein [Chitinophaga pinensis]|uniref:SusC/RagA family TonB-linked outer membrane protein n=2 Tax=Chitinophaga pinensis TaxID=79329 RepID=A0A5C6M1J2_9BACT|nr:SusC/RagA family TonB-linked outer membrane protein [Chitinophaga pinensis]